MARESYIHRRSGRLHHSGGQSAAMSGFLRVLLFSPVNIIPQVLHAHIPSIYNRRYTILVTVSVVKYNTSHFSQSIPEVWNT